MSGQTLFDKIWQTHTVAELGDGYALLHVDRHLLHDLGGGRAVKDITEHGMYGYPEQFIPQSELEGYGALSRRSSSPVPVSTSQEVMA